MGFPFHLQVIDCETSKIVSLPPEHKYAALSYVWGDTPSDTNEYPQTIQDSIETSLAFGLRYLWVDRYCINQDNQAEKHTLISIMDRIYSSAYITIVAISEDANSGLAGISRARKPARRLFLGDLTLEEMRDPDTTINESKWATRAWTFQEGYLSQRLLFFTETGLAFLCRSMYRHGNMNRTSTSREDGTRNNAWAIQSKVRPNFHHRNLDDLIVEYTRRDMTFTEDALNACLGILGALDITHYWGIPILDFHDSGSTYLQMDLCWYIEVRSRRKAITSTAFPTWSWTSQHGTVRPITSRVVRSSLSSIEIQLLDSQWIDIVNNQRYHGNLCAISPGKTLRITGFVLENRLEMDSTQSPLLVLKSACGKDIKLTTSIDDEKTRQQWGSATGCVPDLVALEYEQLGERQADILEMETGIFLLLQRNREDIFHERVGIAYREVNPYLDLSRVELWVDQFHSIIPMAGRTRRTIYLR
ncbi:hypothetical protein ACN47E_005614 [Coniothyrium glycines]